MSVAAFCVLLVYAKNVTVHAQSMMFVPLFPLITSLMAPMLKTATELMMVMMMMTVLLFLLLADQMTRMMMMMMLIMPIVMKLMNNTVPEMMILRIQMNYLMTITLNLISFYTMIPMLLMI